MSDREKLTQALEERDAYHAALSRIAGALPRPILDPYDCEARLRRIARRALDLHDPSHRDTPDPPRESPQARPADGAAAS